MYENERFKKIILWLSSQGIIENQDDLAGKLGYSTGYISHIATGKKPINRKFVNKLCLLSSKLNSEYLLSDSSEMIINPESIHIEEPKSNYTKAMESRVKNLEEKVGILLIAISRMESTIKQLETTIYNDYNKQTGTDG